MTNLQYALHVARHMTAREWAENVAAMGAVWMMLAMGGMW